MNSPDEMVVFPEETVAFDLYFGSLVGFQYHPGAGTKEHIKLTDEECRDRALRMIELRREVLSRIGG